MTRKFLRNTTSIALCIGVALPQIALAQPMENDRIMLAAVDEVAQAGAEVTLVPPVEGQVEDAVGEAEADSETGPEASVEAEAEAAAEIEAEATVESAPEAETPPEPAEAEAEAVPAVEAAADPTDTVEPATQAGAEEAAPDATGSDATATDAGTAQADNTTAESANADTATAAAAEVEAQADGAVETGAEANAAAEAAADVTDETAPDTATGVTEATDAPEIDATATDTTAPDAAAPDAEADAADTAAADASAEASADDAPAAAAPAAEEIVEIPEAEAATTDAAREAAAADAAPEAAALADAEPVATSEAETVTEETSRSATEDFLTDLSGIVRDSGVATKTSAAVTGAATTQAAGDDDDNDLERTLRRNVLPALAGLAVGHMLSNNRQVELNTGDRVVVTRPDGSQEIIKDDNVLLLRPGSTVQTQEYADGSTRTVVTREDGSQVVTIRDADLRVLRRSLIHADGRTVELLDDTVAVQPVDVAALPPPARPITLAPGQQMTEEALREALRRETQVNRSFTLGQIRNIPEVRALVAPVDIRAITFDTGSAAIKADQAQALSTLGNVIAESIRQNPREIYLIEGHTDTVGADAMNLALSDRRAESVALALTQYFDVPPENLVVQGYGEQFLKVQREGDIRENRRAAVRRITDLLTRN